MAVEKLGWGMDERVGRWYGWENQEAICMRGGTVEWDEREVWMRRSGGGMNERVGSQYG